MVQVFEAFSVALVAIIDRLQWLLGLIGGALLTYYVQRALTREKKVKDLYSRLVGSGVLVASRFMKTYTGKANWFFYADLSEVYRTSKEVKGVKTADDLASFWQERYVGSSDQYERCLYQLYTLLAHVETEFKDNAMQRKCLDDLLTLKTFDFSFPYLRNEKALISWHKDQCAKIEDFVNNEINRPLQQLATCLRRQLLHTKKP